MRHPNNARHAAMTKLYAMDRMRKTEQPAVMEGMLFVALDYSVYSPGDVVEAVGLGCAEYVDSTFGEEPALDDRPYIWGRRHDEEPDKCWYFRSDNLLWLTSDAHVLYVELRHLEVQWQLKWGKLAR